MKADLHIHSCHSDGRYSPGQLVEYAAQNTLDIIALTDHDTTSGLAEAREYARKFPLLRVIPGVEISTNQDDDELHILGYGINEEAPNIKELLQQAQKNRKKRIHRILESLKTAHITLNFEDVGNGNNSVSLGRLHVARLLVRRGHVRTIREAFDRYLSYETNLISYSATDFVSSQKAIETILDAGGMAVLAHPTIALFDRYIDRLIEFGLQGVEVFKSSRTSIEEFYLETVVKDKGLVITGGSDWHGYHPTIQLGKFYVDAARIQLFLNSVDALKRQ
jgi:predicted metal-dependent phosphoesterase TrpH